MIDFPDFGNIGSPQMMEERLIDTEQARVEAAKDILMQRAELAVTDHNGRYLNGRKWRAHMNFLWSL